MIKPGTVIKTKNFDACNRYIIEKWTVKKIYPHHVLCENKIGLRRCFCYGDLIVNGIVKQSEDLELLKGKIELD